MLKTHAPMSPDYCNSLFIEILAETSCRLRLIQNAVAGVLTRTKRSEHIALIFRNIHWLPKIFLLVYKYWLHSIHQHQFQSCPESLL